MRLTRTQERPPPQKETARRGNAGPSQSSSKRDGTARHVKEKELSRGKRVDLRTKLRFAYAFSRDPQLTNKAKAVASVLLEDFNDGPEARHKGFAWPGYSRIAERAHVDRRQISRIIGLLVVTGYFEVLPGNVRKSNLYRPLWARAVTSSGVQNDPRVKSGRNLGSFQTQPRVILHSQSNREEKEEPIEREPARKAGSSFDKRKRDRPSRSDLEAYQPSSLIADWAAQHVPHLDEPLSHAEAFRLWHVKNGKVPADLDAAFKDWLLREQAFQARASKPIRKTNAAMANDLLWRRVHEENPDFVRKEEDAEV